MKSPMPKIPSIPSTLLRILGVLVVAALLVGVVLKSNPVDNAQATSNQSCTSAGNGDWSNPANWNCSGNPGAVPGSGDTAIIDNNDITVTADQSIKDVSVHSNASLTINNNVKLSVEGTLDVSATTGLSTVFYDDNPPYAPIGGGKVEFGSLATGGNQVLNTNGSWLYFWDMTKLGSGSLKIDSCTSDKNTCDGGFEVVNSLTLQGTAPSYVLLRSATEGIPWTMVPEQIPAISSVDVEDSINNGNAINVTNGINSGNNAGWKFIGLSSSRNPSLVEQDVTFTLTLPEGATDTSVTFMDGLLTLPCTNLEGEKVNPASVDNGVATCETGELAAGKHTISVAYSGGTAQLDQIVSKSTNLALQSSVQPSAKDANVTFTAYVMPADSAGTVNFKADDAAIQSCTGQAVNTSTGTAVCTIPMGTVGNHIITAEFVPSGANMEGSLSTLLVQTVKNLTSVSVASSKIKIDRNQTVTLTATITSPAAGGTATFMDDGYLIAGCTNIPVVGGQAACNVSNLKFGSHNITVFYSGDATNFSSSSPAIVQKINTVYFMPKIGK